MYSIYLNYCFEESIDFTKFPKGTFGIKYIKNCCRKLCFSFLRDMDFTYQHDIPRNTTRWLSYFRFIAQIFRDVMFPLTVTLGETVKLSL